MAAIFAFRCALLAAVVVPLAAETLDPINDLRLGVTIQRAPRISEIITPPAGSGKNYNWEGNKRWGARYDIEYDRGSSPRHRDLSSLLWTIGLSYADTNITPDSYDYGSGSSSNTRDDLQLSYRQYGALAGIGWGTPPLQSDLADIHWEISAIGRGGLSVTETASPGLRSGIEKANSPYWEAGARASMVLCDNDWLLSVTIGWLYGRNSVNVNLPNGYSSELLIIRNGIEAGLQTGMRF